MTKNPLLCQQEGTKRFVYDTIHPKQVYCIIRPPIFPYNFLGKGGLFLCQLRSTPVSPLRKRTAKA